MAHEPPHTMGQQHGRRSWAEPWKIKMVEPLTVTTRGTPSRARGATHLPAPLPGVYIDLLTSGTRLRPAVGR